ncbi:MAG: glycoside hydrolase [Lachnospiraceae bacterium]|nr:glycoside hydrolase [Lachnospiraceae bacterium]
MKIAVIGGAGVRTVIFINGLLDRYKKLNITEVALFDIDKDKLKVIEKLCKYVVSRKNEELKVYSAETAKEAVTNADYIVTTLRVGGDHSRTMDEEIATKLGVIGQETTGVGGFSMAVRTIPTLLEYCKMFKETAPNAWIFNFTNPSGLVTQALRSEGYDRVIGICDAPSSMKFRMANYLGTTEKDLYIELFGLNHLSWVRSVKDKDKEILEDLLHNDKFLQDVQEFRMFDPELLRYLHMLPNEYLYYYYHREQALAHMTNAESMRGKTIESVNKDMMRELRAMDMDADPHGALQTFLYYMEKREQSYMSVETGAEAKLDIQKGNLEVPDGMGYAGVMLDCIEGMQSDEARSLVLSLPNNGSMNCLNDDDVIEVTCNVSKKGIIPVKIGDVPEHTRILIQNIKYYEKKTIEAIKEKSLEKAVDALTLHPLINSYSLAKELVEAYDRAYDGLFK